MNLFPVRGMGVNCNRGGWRDGVHGVLELGLWRSGVA